MDFETLAAYDRDAAAFAQDWETQPTPSDMQDLLRHFFQPGPTADVGCGSGRDTAWLSQNGFAATGYDASAGLLDEARRLHPHLPFKRASLPELAGVAEGTFVNVLCETVIMHLPTADVAPSVQQLMAILRPRGTLYLSWRVIEADNRDAHGRLYAAVDPAIVLSAAMPSDVLFDEQRVSVSSGKTVRRLVLRKA